MNTPVPPIQTCHHLFVYGSLRSGFKNEAYHYLSQYFDCLGMARSKGRLYDNGLYPVGKDTDEDHYVLGELYRIKNPYEYDYAMMQLDDYEGVNVEEGEAPFYVRAITLAQTDDGGLIPAWVYWYNGDVSEMKPLDTGDMLAYLTNK